MRYLFFKGAQNGAKKAKKGFKRLAAKNFIFRILMLGVFCYAMKLSFNVALAWETANIADLILGPMIALPLLWIPFNKGVKAFIEEAKADADNNTK